MAKIKEYRHIRSWGMKYRSLPFYIAGEQIRAAKEGAPVDAIYKDTTRGMLGEQKDFWVCASDLDPGHEFLEYHENYWDDHK